MIKLLFIVFSIAVCLVNTTHAEVYRSVDESGNVIFTDKAIENSEKVDLPGLTTYKSLPYKKIKANKEAKNFTSYTVFKILSPANKDTIRDPEGNVSIEIQITPELQVRLGHRIVLYVDGIKVDSTTVTKYKLTNVDKGAHTLSAHVVDSIGKHLSKLVSTEFYIVQVEDIPNKEAQTDYEADYEDKAEPKNEKRYGSEPEPENRYEGEPKRDDLHTGEPKDPNKYKVTPEPKPKNLYKPTPPPTPNYKIPN